MITSQTENTKPSQLPSCCDRVRRDTSQGVVVGPCEPLLEDLGLADPFWKIVAAEIMTKKANKNAKQCGKKWRKPKSGKKKKQSADNKQGGYSSTIFYPWKFGATLVRSWTSKSGKLAGCWDSPTVCCQVNLLHSPGWDMTSWSKRCDLKVIPSGYLTKSWKIKIFNR